MKETKVLCILSKGYEELEAIGTIALLRRAGISVDIFSLDGTSATGRFQLTLSEVCPFQDITIDAYDALFIPGGPHYQTLQSNEQVLALIQAFYQAGKIIAAICAAPTILGHMGLLKGRSYTCFTSMNEDFQGTYKEDYAVVDGNIITGKSAAAVIDFGFAIIKTLLGSEKAKEVKQSIYYKEHA